MVRTSTFLFFLVVVGNNSTPTGLCGHVSLFSRQMLFYCGYRSSYLPKQAATISPVLGPLLRVSLRLLHWQMGCNFPPQNTGLPSLTDKMWHRWHQRTSEALPEGAWQLLSGKHAVFGNACFLAIPSWDAPSGNTASILWKAQDAVRGCL